MMALAVHRSKIGYAVLEGPSRLLDWGVLGCTGAETLRRAVVPQRLISLLNFYRPQFVAFRLVKAKGRDSKRIEEIDAALQGECTNRFIRLFRVHASTIKTFFAAHSCKTRLQIAQVLGEWFSELAWQVPPKRKPWQSDSHNMPIFEAVAVGVAHFRSLAECRLTPSNG
jgi:hypothetical protein